VRAAPVSPAGPRRLHPGITLLLRALISVALLGLVAWRLDWKAAGAALLRVDPGTLALCTALALIGYGGRALRWLYLLRLGGVALRGAEAYRLTLLGIFYGMLTPGRVGELGRAFHLGLPAARTLPSVIWDRLADILLLELLSLPAFVVLRAGPGGGAGYGMLLAAYLAVVLVTVVAMAVLDSPGALTRLARAVPRAAGAIAGWRQSATGMLRSRAFARGLAAGLFFYALNFAGAVLLLDRLAPGHPRTLALLFPLIILLGNLPVAFGGLGLREQVSAAAFGRLGASAAVGPVFSLLWFLVVTVIPALIGLVLAGGARARVGAPHMAPTGAPTGAPTEGGSGSGSGAGPGSGDAEAEGLHAR